MMLWNLFYGVSMPILLALAIGLPVASLLRLSGGLRTIGFAAACGAAMLLIVCRGAQMAAPIDNTKWVIAAILVCALVLLWRTRNAREQACALVREHGAHLLLLALAGIAVVVLIDAPLIFSDAIQFEGTRNADSFTFTSNARYMLHHAFYGAPDFSPAHPIYTISRAYFGADPMQPRPAAEGLLALLSAYRGVDPMYLYNAVQTAGMLLAGLAALAFLPKDWKPASRSHLLPIIVFSVASPALFHVVMNSNFANVCNLPAATAYVALALIPRSRSTFGAGALFIGCLLSGYPEILPFAAVARALAVIWGSFQARPILGALRAALIEGLWLLLELVVAAALLPWAAMGTLADYRTTLNVSHRDASDLGGNMYAGLPMFVAGLLATAVAWRSNGATWWRMHARPVCCGVLAAFAIAQAAMALRGFNYGGFKLSEYFATFLGAILVMVAATPDRERTPGRQGRVIGVILAVLAIVMVAKAGDLLRRSWDWSKGRRVTPDLVRAGEALAKLAQGRPVAMGSSPQPFYYGMWVPYVAAVPIAYDLNRDPSAAGYLSPYLHTTAKEAAALYDQARLEIVVADPDATAAPTNAIVQFGRVSVVAKGAGRTSAP